MINQKGLNRILKHLEKYNNTIIVENDYVNDSLDNLILRIEEEGWQILQLFEGRNVGSCQNHYVVYARRRQDAKPKRKTKPAKKKL